MPRRTLRVDRFACTGRGLCAAMLPERIALDDWGYPIVDPRPFETAAVAAAVRICPRQALLALAPPRPTERTSAPLA